MLLAACATAPLPTPSLLTTITLTSSRPSASVPLTAGVSILEIRLVKIDNPSVQPITVFVTIQVTTADDKTATFEVGTATPFPADQTGTFLLPLPSDVQSTLDAHPKSAAVGLQLRPIATQADLMPDTSVVVAIGQRPKAP